MKKSTIKLTSTLLMLSLMSTSLSAAILSHDDAAIKIQRQGRLYRDRKLNQTFEELNQTSKNIKRGVVPGPTEADLEKSIASLNEHSDFKSMGLPAVYFINAKDLDIRPFVGPYQRYIQSQMASRDPIRRQIASLIMAELATKAAAENDKFNTARYFLQEAMNSEYPFFKNNAYMQLSGLAKGSGAIDQAFSYLKKGLILPNRYHASIYRKLAYIVGSEEYKPTQERYLKKNIETGTPKEKAKALMSLAYLYGRNEANSEFYRPSEALDIYDSLLTDPQLIPFLDIDNVHIQMAKVLAWASDEKIKNVDRATEILDGILLKRSNDLNYSKTINELISILITKDPTRAFSLAREALSNPNLQQPFKTYIEKALADLYRNGPEGTRNYQEALRILEKHAAATYGKDFDPNYRLYTLQSLAQILLRGDVPVKNVARAIQINEDLRKDSKVKLTALIDLAYLYQHDAEHKNLSKTIEYYEEILLLHEGKPAEQFNTLIRLLSLYTTEGETLNLEKAQNIQQRISEMQPIIESNNSKESFIALHNLIGLLTFGNDRVKDRGRAIPILEELSKHSEYKLISLQTLVYIHEHIAHRNPVKLAECLNELVELYVDKPLEQLKTLTQLLKIYATEEEAFNIAEAKAAVERILTHSAVDGTARLEVQITLSKLFQLHPESGSAAEIIDINNELAHNLMATPLDVGDAHRRLITAYLEQQNFEQVFVTYERFLTRTVDWQHYGVIRDFISFLTQSGIHPERLEELQHLIQQPIILPQNGDFMAADEHHVPGVIAGFGGAGYVDPFFSPEMIANRKASLLALSRDPFVQMNYQTNLERTVAEVKETIAQYGARDPDFAATAAIATEIFETGNSHPISFRSAVNHLDYPFSYDDDTKTMTYGEALVRIWTRITEHPKANYLKDLIIVQLAAARDPDGHIVCEVGKTMRHFQAMEGTFPDIHAATLSLKDIFSHFAEEEQKLIDTLPEGHPLKILESKIGEIREAGEYKVDADNWVSPEYQGKFESLSSDDRTLLNDQYEQMVLKFEQELLKSRDALSEAEKTFARREAAKYLSVVWFVG
jgi:hypothetical protein